MSDPASYLTLDPGRRMGWASCLRGGGDLCYGTWKFLHEDPGEAYASFLKQLGHELQVLPDVQVGMEQLTIVPHEDDKGRALIDANQVELSAGWANMTKTKCFLVKARRPEMIAISSWRSKTHGKTRAPETVKEGGSSKWLKQQAFKYCHDNGWKPDSDNAAEALCMLDYMRILHEPSFAFDRGHAFQQERLFG